MNSSTNNDDYLWNREGDPDPELQRLEQLLRPLRHEDQSPAPRRPLWRVGLVAAAAAAALVVMWPRPEPTAWRLNDQALRRGQIVEQGRVLSASVGSLEVEPGSRLHLEGRNRFRLERGTLRALVWAAPREFVIDTPAATAVDLGCAYTLSVSPDGSGLLSVLSGWVALGSSRHEAFVPAGAECRTRRGHGPGIPYYQNSSPELRAGLARWDSGDPSALDATLRGSSRRDALSLWHLIPRTTGEQRVRVVNRLAELVPLHNRSGLLLTDPKAMDEAWAALGLGSAAWWRGWKRNL